MGLCPGFVVFPGRILHWAFKLSHKIGGEVLIRDGTFAKNFIGDQDAGAPAFKKFREQGAALPIEAVGKDLCALMSRVKGTDSDFADGFSLPLTSPLIR